MTQEIFGVDVAVALKRPPRIDEYRRYIIAAESGDEAELIAQQWAYGNSAMPVWSVVTDWPVA